MAMWWVMMVAMMIPAAAPSILLYARVHRHSNGPDPLRRRPLFSPDISPAGALSPSVARSQILARFADVDGAGQPRCGSGPFDCRWALPAPAI